MAASRQNFFQAHWDWLLAFVGVASLAAAGTFLAMSLGVAPDDAAGACETRLGAVVPSHEGVAPVDLDILQKAYRITKAPPALKEVDGKKANFLASERRVFCQNGDETAKTKSCGKPIPADLEVCPRCGAKQRVVKVEVDSDNDGLPNDWEKKYALNPNDSADAELDPDNDGFTNIEEFKAGTNPSDPKSHPDYLDSLAISGELNQTVLPFWLKSYSQIKNGFRFYFQMLDKNGDDVKGYNATLNAVAGGQVGKTGYFVGEFKKLSELRAIAGSKTGAKRPVDVSTLELVRKADGKKVVIAISVRRNPVETQVPMSYSRGKHSWDKTVSEGAEIDLNGEKYRIVKLKPLEKGCEVTVENLKTKKQKVIR